MTFSEAQCPRVPVRVLRSMPDEEEMGGGERGRRTEKNDEEETVAESPVRSERPRRPCPVTL